MALIVGEVTGVPEPNNVLVVDESEYHSSVVPVGTVAVSVDTPEPQTADAAAVVTAAAAGFTVLGTVARVADIQPYELTDAAYKFLVSDAVAITINES